MANTFIKISTITVGSGGAASIDFTSIPATYTDLLIKVSGRSTSGGGDLGVTFNGSGGTAYSSQILYGSGSGAASTSQTGQAAHSWAGGPINPSTSGASIFANSEIYIPNYTSANYKSSSTDGVAEDNATGAYSFLVASLWASTSAINQVTLTPSSSGNFVQYSSATLYGIKSS